MQSLLLCFVLIDDAVYSKLTVTFLTNLQICVFTISLLTSFDTCEKLCTALSILFYLLYLWSLKTNNGTDCMPRNQHLKWDVFACYHTVLCIVVFLICASRILISLIISQFIAADYWQYILYIFIHYKGKNIKEREKQSCGVNVIREESLQKHQSISSF